MRVSELMSRGVVTIGVSDTCHEAMVRMVSHRTRHLPVIGERGGLDGIVTDRDLRHYLFRPGVFEEVGRASVEVLLRRVAVGQIMSAPVIHVDPSVDVEAAAEIMSHHRVGSVPVVDAGRVVGILTETDLLRHVVRTETGGSQLLEDIVVPYP